MENFQHALATGLYVLPVAKEPEPYQYLNRFQVRRKKIINVETGEIYESIADLADKLGYTAKYVRKKVSGELPNNTPYQYLGTYSSQVINRPWEERKTITQ